jgi:capsular exopolysaccharide synthesis family protein
MPFAGGDEAPGGGAEDPARVIASPEIATTPASAAVNPVPYPEATLPAPVEPPEEIGILELARVALRGSPVIGALVVVAVAAAAIYNSMATRYYQARARIVIDPEAGQVVPFQNIGNDPSRDDYLFTQLEVLRSRALAQAALERLQRLPGGQSAQMDMRGGALSVALAPSERGMSRVVDIFFTSTNPQVAARIANAVAQTYVNQNIEGRKSVNREATNLLNQRLEEMRQEVTSTEGALQQYREQRDGVSLESDQNIVVQKLAQLNAAYTSARAERVQKEALYQQLTAMEQAGAPLDTFPSIVSNTFIQGLKADLAGLQRERLQRSERLGDLHPDMIQINTAIDTAQRRLGAEMAKVVEGIRNDYVGAKAGEEALAASLAAQEREVLAQNKRAIGYRALTRDATSTQQMFATLQQRVKEMEVSGELQSNNIRILELAEVPASPVWPRARLNLALALFGSTFVGIVLVVGVQYLKPKIVDPEHIAQSLGLRLIGVAPRVSRPDAALSNLTSVPVPFQEAVRGIRTQIFLSSGPVSLKTIAITSANPGEGKSVIAGSLAVSMARTGRRVLLVDADMRRSQVDRLLNVRRSPGLSNVITGEVPASEAITQSSVQGLFILPAGTKVESPGDLLDHEQLKRLIQSFSQVFDLVVFDCPPVTVAADATIVANAVTSVLFVVGAGTTSPETARDAVERLMSVHARVLGVVLNKTNLQNSHYYYRYDAAEEKTA